jgi:phage I-like protein
VAPPESKDGKPVLNAAQLAAAKVLGIAPDDYAKTLAAEQAAREETA